MIRFILDEKRNILKMIGLKIKRKLETVESLFQNSIPTTGSLF